MSQNVANNLSNEDLHLIESYQLGTFEGIYRLKAGYISFYRRVGLGLLIFCFVVTAFVVIILLLRGLPKLPQQQIIDFPPLLLGILGITLGGYMVRFEVPRLMSGRAIICDSGLLSIKGSSVEVVRWEDILKISCGFIGLECSIIRRGGKMITLSFYQDLNELIALIRERSGEVYDDD
jgi:hypothetical protein